MAGKKKNMLLQGSILAGAGLITKVIGFAYRIPMGNMLGEEGNGIYSVAFGIYSIALTISSFSLPLAVSKMVSARMAKAEYRNMRTVVANATTYALLAGILAMNVLFFGAGVFEKIYDRPGLAMPLRVLAPTTFIVALLGVYRGFFQGQEDMVPTSISQVLEQAVNAVVSVFVTWQFLKIYKGSTQAASIGAAGGTFGTLAGAAAALVIMIMLFIPASAQYQRKVNPNERQESSGSLYKELFMTIIPVILSQTTFQIGYTLDDLIFGNLMAAKGFADQVTASLQGVFNTQYNQLVNLPVAIASSMAMSVLPSIAVSKMQNDIRGVHGKITQIIKVNMVVAFPSAVGLAVLADPIMRMLFPRLVTYRQQAVLLLITGSSAIVFYALSTLTTSILQGYSYMRIPVIHSVISLGIHVVLLALLLLFTDLGVYALVICNILFPLVISILNCRAIVQKVGYQWEYVNTFAKPLFASVAMGMVAAAVYHVLHLATGSVYAATIAAMSAAVVVYVVTILQIRCFGEDELDAVPGGRKLAHFIR